MEYLLAPHPVGVERSHQELSQGNAKSAAELPVLQHPIFGKSASLVEIPDARLVQDQDN